MDPAMMYITHFISTSICHLIWVGAFLLVLKQQDYMDQVWKKFLFFLFNKCRNQIKSNILEEMINLKMKNNLMNEMKWKTI